MTKPSFSKKFVLGLKEHKYLGYLPVPMYIEDCRKEYCKIIGLIHIEDLKIENNQLSEIQKEIVKLANYYSDNYLFRNFKKDSKSSLTDFYKNFDKNDWKKIFDFIDEKKKKVLQLAKDNNIDFFLKPHRYENIYSEDKISYSNHPLEAKFYFERTSEGVKYFIKVFYKQKEIKIYQKKVFFIVNNPCICVIDGVLHYFENIDAKKIEPFVSKEFIFIPKHLEIQYFSKFVKSIISNYSVVNKGFEIREIFPSKKALLYVKTSYNDKMIFIPKFKYGNKEFFFSLNESKVIDFDKDNFVFTYFYRDLQWEKNLISKLRQLGFKPYSDVAFIVYEHKIPALQVQESVNFLNKNIDTLKQAGFEIVQSLDKKYFIDKIKLNFEVKNKIDWFDIYAYVYFGDYKVPFLQLKDYILSGNREFPLPNGEIAIIPEEWFTKYKTLLLFGQKEKEKIKLKKHHFLFLDFKDNKSLQLPEVEDIKKFFEETKKIPPLPKGLKTKLRNYQLQGYAWLSALQKYNFGGCLADDMGLGKTLQTLTVILKTVEEHREKGQKINNLIVMPKSLLHNWENEIKKFTPSLSVMLYAGNDRKKLLHLIPSFDIILTSYGVVRNDFERLKQREFFYLVLDESHFIKNPTSKIYYAVNQLNAKHKLVLTGTPIENSLRDLWTQMNFINKGLLGSLSFFQKFYINPIEKSKDENVRDELRKIIAPFLLRRKKEEVFDDLPELIEQNIICEMSDEQTYLYEIEKAKVRNKILEIYNDGKLKKSGFYVLQALTKLRQIANHPNLIDNSKPYSSGKFEETLLRLETLLAQGHKVLLFSSFVKFLNLFAKEFDKRNWKYRMLIGNTENRKQVIDDFQKRDDISLFLISLKVGGVGLNLTAADYVFLLDPWWNPAAEKQAISRTHRLGQDKNIIVQRFITYNTIEEKIQKLQEKKLFLSDELIENENIFAKIPENEILDLFS